jgi:hypothetical protein
MVPLKYSPFNETKSWLPNDESSAFKRNEVKLNEAFNESIRNRTLVGRNASIDVTARF